MISVAVLSKVLDKVVLCRVSRRVVYVYILLSGRGTEKHETVSPQPVCDLVGLIRHMLGERMPSYPQQKQNTYKDMCMHVYTHTHVHTMIFHFSFARVILSALNVLPLCSTSGNHCSSFKIYFR